MKIADSITVAETKSDIEDADVAVHFPGLVWAKLGGETVVASLGHSDLPSVEEPDLKGVWSYEFREQRPSLRLWHWCENGRVLPKLPKRRKFDASAPAFGWAERNVPEPPEQVTSRFLAYNNRYWPVLKGIEKRGLKTDTELLRQNFGISVSRLYPSFNVFGTKTGRPSNTSQGVNLASLTKLEAQSFVADQTFFGFDYDAFHLRLLGKLAGTELPSGSLHRHLFENYYEDVVDTYDEAKKLTFQVMYGKGGIPKELLQIPIFKAVQKFQNQDLPVTTGFHEREVGSEDLENKPKALSYFLQSSGFEFVMDRAWQLRNAVGYPAHYLYDSLVYDTSSDNVPLIKSVLEGDGSFPVSVKKGKRLSDVI